jgi:hypothetical protein
METAFEDAMSYVNCPRCGLAVRLRAPFLAVRHCPRCVARRGIAVEMLISEPRTLPAPTRQADRGAAHPAIHQLGGSARSHDPVGQRSAISQG